MQKGPLQKRGTKKDPSLSDKLDISNRHLSKIHEKMLKNSEFSSDYITN